MPVGQLARSSSALISSPVRDVVPSMRSATTSRLSRGLPRKFTEMWLNNRCSTLFHLEGPRGPRILEEQDPQIDADLQKGRTDSNDADRVADYQDIAKRFAVDVPFIWTNETIWADRLPPSIHGIVGWTLPDGTPGVDHTLSTPSGHRCLISHVWTSQGERWEAAALGPAAAEAGEWSVRFSAETGRTH
jgi:hypothetical protein